MTTKRRKQRQAASVLTPEDIEDYRKWWEERHPEQADVDNARRFELVKREWQD